MPTYRVDFPDGSSYQVDSPSELKEPQVIAHAQRQAAEGKGDKTDRPSRQISQPGQGDVESGAPPSADQPKAPSLFEPLEDYAARTWGRVIAAKEAAANIPHSAAELIAPIGPSESRVQGAIGLLSGVTSPFAALLSPVGAAFETASRGGLGTSEETAKIIGDIGEIGSTLGLGLATQAGKVSPLGMKLSNILGVQPIKPQSGEGLMTRRSTSDERLLEILANRDRPAIETLAIRAKSGPLAEIDIADKTSAWRQWKDATDRLGFNFNEPPKPPTFRPNPKLEFQPADLNLVDTLGTPLTRALARNPEAAKHYAEIDLIAFRIEKAVAARDAKDIQQFSKLQPRQLEKVLTAREAGVRSLLNPLENETLQYVKKAYDEDLSLYRTFVRDQVRPGIEKQVRSDVKLAEKISEQELSETQITAHIDRLVKERIPDSWGLEDYVTHIFPGDYLIKNKKGQVLGSAENKMGAKLKVHELIDSGGAKPGELRVDRKSYMDSKLLKGYNKKTAAALDENLKATELSKEELAAAEQGRFGITGKTKFNPFIQKRGSSTGYSRDLAYIRQVYNRVTERYFHLTELSKKIEPAVSQLRARGFPAIADDLADNMKTLWGFRPDVSYRFDAQLQAIPIVRDLVAPQALERWSRRSNQLTVAGFIKYSPAFHIRNSLQTFSTLWPIASIREIYQGIRLLGTAEGKAILESHGAGAASRVGGGLGPIETYNQQVAFLTMFNRAMKLGYKAEVAADYGILRGNLYSQFAGLSTDRPALFRKLDPASAITLFQRFGVKQVEQLIDLMKDRNVSGAGKWLATLGVMGGVMVSMLGGTGWLSYEAYKEIEKRYGKTTADIIHVGLPTLVGIDNSNSAMVLNLPMGRSLSEATGFVIAGPLGSTVGSAITAGMNLKGVEPSAGRRIVNSLVQRVPLAREFDSVRRIIMDDYDLTTVDGKLKYTADVKDLFKMSFGFRPIKDADLTLLANAVTDVRKRRDEVLDYAASRYGQAELAGVGLAPEMEEAIRKDIDRWNQLWGDILPITGRDLMVRSKARQEAGILNLRERIIKSAPKKLRPQLREESPIMPPP